MARVLYLDAGGMPLRWISLEAAACLYTREQVLWELGSPPQSLRGGYNRSGLRSSLDIAPVIAGCRVSRIPAGAPSLTNAKLFARDQYLCLYCGEQFPRSVLTRDHIVPVSRGGLDTWKNTCAACKRCNQAKGARTPEEAGMPLLAVPFVPNRFEAVLLQAHTILADQMTYLKAGLSQNRDWDGAANIWQIPVLRMN